jgi:hypothetical protein
MNKASDSTIMIFIMVGIFLFEALMDILSLFRQGIMKSRESILMKKTNAELRLILKGFNKISKLNKKELVGMVIAYC